MKHSTSVSKTQHLSDPLEMNLLKERGFSSENSVGIDILDNKSKLFNSFQNQGTNNIIVEKLVSLYY